jgi:hypothetical protein
MDLRTVSMTRSQDGPLVSVAREGEIFNRVRLADHNHHVFSIISLSLKKEGYR